MAAVRLLSRIAFALALVAMLCIPPRFCPVVSKPTRGPVASSFFYPEVRLRKLHLVRPDLIPYPIYYEIYC